MYSEMIAQYRMRLEESAELAFPVIKNVYETKSGQYKRIVVPFSDGVKTLQVVTNLEEAYHSKGTSLIDDFEKNISLAIIDDSWKTHLRKMDELKQSVQLAVHEQKDPLLIYKFEAFELFKTMIDAINKEIISFLFKGVIPQENQNTITEAKRATPKQKLNLSKEEVLNSDQLAEQNRAVGNSASRASSPQVETIVRDKPKIGRNERVTIKHLISGETKVLKYKQAENLLQGGEWVLIQE